MSNVINYIFRGDVSNNILFSYKNDKGKLVVLYKEEYMNIIEDKGQQIYNGPYQLPQENG